MSGYVRCACCNLPIAVDDDDIGLTVNCPRTGRMVSVRVADIRSGSPTSKPPTSLPASEPTQKPTPIANKRPTPIPGGKPTVAKHPQTAPISAKPPLLSSPQSPKRNRRLALTSGVLGILLLIGGSIFAAYSWSSSAKNEDRGSAKLSDSTKSGTEPGGETPQPARTDTSPPIVPTGLPSVPLGRPATTSGTASPPITASPAPASTPPAPASTPPASPPARPLPASLNQLKSTYRQEVVRVNHPRNCVLCHAPSFQETDLIRGAIPDPRQPLPPPTTPAYYRSGGQFVTAETTYLRQDFSVVQPVPDAGNWSSHQRYDYFVSIRKVDGVPVTGAPVAGSPYLKAIGFALQDLSGHDPTRDADWLAEQHRVAGSLNESQLSRVAKFVSLQANPNALLTLKYREFSQPLLKCTNEELEKCVSGLLEVYGETAARAAIIAYLYAFIQSEDDKIRGRAARLIAVAIYDTSGAALPAAFRNADRVSPFPTGIATPTVLGPLNLTPKIDPGLMTTTKDIRGYLTYSLSKRIDKRATEELERELLAVREVSLNDPTGGRGASELVALAQERKSSGQPYPGSAVVCEGRPDLAGLPFSMGLDATLKLENAQAMNALSVQLREGMQFCIRNPNDPRPDTDQLHKMLTGASGFTDGLGRRRGFSVSGGKEWATAESVPCIQQMLQAENREIRRMSCELLRRVDAIEATEALVQWAVFDTDAGNRATAVSALRSRDRRDVTRLLLKYVRYPWPRAVEHAVETLVALDCKEAIPSLAALYGLPDPDAPFSPQVGSRTVALEPAPMDVRVPGTEPAPMLDQIALGLRMGEAVLVSVEKQVEEATRLANVNELEQHIKASKDSDAEVRRQAVMGLARFLTNPDVQFRRKAAQAFADLGANAEPAEGALRNAAKDPDAEVRKLARRTLEVLEEIAAAKKAAKIRDEILALAKDLKAKETAKRIKALEEISVHGSDANFIGEQIIAAMTDSVPKVAKAASDALEKVNPKVHPHATTLLFGMDKLGAIRSLAKLKVEAAIAVPLLLHCQAERFSSASIGGVRLENSRNLDEPFQAIAIIAPKDKRFATAVLASIAAPTVEINRTILTGLEARIAGLKLLNVIDAEPIDKVKALVAALGDGCEAVKVITALGQLGRDAEPALSKLNKLKLSPNDDIRKAATEAIKKIE